MFKYPCSFLIYTDGFKQLPSGVMSQVKKRLVEVLSGEDESKEFAHLSAKDRTAIKSILEETGVLPN